MLPFLRKQSGKVRVVIYARRSKTGVDKDVSIAEQVRACRAYAEKHGWEVVGVREEPGRSGFTGKGRPVFMSMISDAQRQPRPFDVVLTWNLARFGRADGDETGHWRYLLKDAGVRVVHVHEGERYEGLSGQVMRKMDEVGANKQLVDMSASMVRHQVEQVRSGHWAGGTVAYGLRSEHTANFVKQGKCDSVLVIVEEKAAVIRRIYAMALDGMGRERIARVLNEEQIPSPKGGKWTTKTIRVILRNPIYMGRYVRGANRPGKPRSRPKYYAGTECGAVLCGEGVEIGDLERVTDDQAVALEAGVASRTSVPAIVDEGTWARVQALMDERAQEKAATGGSPRLLSGIARCGECGGPIGALEGRTFTLSTGERKRYRYYGCVSSKNRGERGGACSKIRVAESKFDAAVLGAIRVLAASLDCAAVAAEVGEHMPASTPKAQVGDLERRRAALATRRRSLVLDLNGSPEFLREAIGDLAKEDERLEAEIRKAKAAETQVGNVEELIRSSVEAALALEEPESEEGRAALREVVKQFVAALRVDRAPAYAPKPVTLDLRRSPGLEALPATGDPGLPQFPGRSS